MIHGKIYKPKFIIISIVYKLQFIFILQIYSKQINQTFQQINSLNQIRQISKLKLIKINNKPSLNKIQNYNLIQLIKHKINNKTAKNSITMSNAQNHQNQPTDLFVYEPPTQQQYQYKIFINECDSYIGSELVQQFRNDHLIQANPNIIIGTSTNNTNGQSNIELPSGVNHIIDTSNHRLYNSVLLQSDIILFTLNQDNVQQFQYILKLLKNSKLQKDKRLICVTQFLSWAKRSHSNHTIQVNKQSLHLRNSLDYHIKSLEDMCLALHNQNNKIKSSVVFSGLIYGLGQNDLFSYFKTALQQEKPLQIYGNGTNHIPMIHLRDLAQIIYNIAFKQYQSKKNWHFASDNSTFTQKKLIQLIASNLGNGSFVQRPIQQCFYKQNFNMMTLDLKVNDPQKLSEWHSFDGLQANIEKIVSQFNQYRGLKPNKILIIGPPLSGKSSVAEILKKNYGLPVISTKSLINDIKQDQSEFGNQIKKILEQIKAQKVEQQRKVHEQLKKKKKGKGVQQFDPEKVVPRLPDQHLRRVIKWRLNFSDCLNKGYILDSVIKTYKNAQGVFINEQNSLNDMIMPNSIFYIKCTNQQIKQRLKGLPAQKTQNTHWNQQATTRRLQTYEKQNQQKNLSQFFVGKVDIKQVEFGESNSQTFVKFIQRNGPLGFKKEEAIPSQNVQKLEQNKQNVQNNENEDDQQNDNQEGENELQIEQEFNLEKLTAKQQKILNQKSRPIRQYLIDNVIPQITEGLLQICKQVPQDPIDFLISFLDNKNMKRKK